LEEEEELPISVLVEMRSPTVLLWPEVVAVVATAGTGIITTEVTVVVSREKQEKQTTDTMPRIVVKEEHKPQEERVQLDGVLLQDHWATVVVQHITVPAVVVVTTVEVLVTTVVVPVEDLALRSTQPQRLRTRKDTNPVMV
jgi:hypothetical protein